MSVLVVVCPAGCSRDVFQCGRASRAKATSCSARQSNDVLRALKKTAQAPARLPAPRRTACRSHRQVRQREHRDMPTDPTSPGPQSLVDLMPFAARLGLEIEHADATEAVARL